MDSESSFEFHKIFKRVSGLIDLQGKFSAEKIEKALIRVVKKCKRQRRKADTISERKKLKRDVISIKRLVEHGFPKRVIREAIINPNGIVAYTLRFGKDEAEKRILAQKRSEIRAKLRRRRR